MQYEASQLASSSSGDLDLHLILSLLASCARHRRSLFENFHRFDGYCFLALDLCHVLIRPCWTSLCGDPPHHGVSAAVQKNTS